MQQLQKNVTNVLDVKINKVILNRAGSQTVIINNAVFKLAANQIYTIIGRNGSGKSTLTKALTGLLDKRFYSVYGEVLLAEKNLLALNYNELKPIRKEKIKYVFQDAKNSFDQLKKFKYYFENINAHQDEIKNVLDYLLLPKSEELFKLHPFEVSGGMAQRISFALAILSKPSLIILDEPTSGIDSAIANLFLLKLKEFVKLNSNSVLLVTQDLAFAKMISNKISLLSNTTLSPFLSPSEFFESKSIFDDREIIDSHLQISK